MTEPHKESGGHAATTSNVRPIDGRDHCIGPTSAPRSLVEYGDYGAEASAQASALAKEIVREFEDEICYVFRNFPNAERNPLASAASEAAEAADMQGKFWLMHDRLFQHYDDLSEALFRRLASELPIEMDDYDKDLRSGAPARRVAEDVAGGRAAGVTTTPTYFVNGRRYTGPHELDPLLDALNART
jgi:Na+:H+ antiporter, NhaA family